MLIASYAKVNLFLEVLAKLPGNYHQIETLLCSVSLCDTIKYALTKKQGVKLWSNLPEMAVESNLIHKVALFLLDEYKPKHGVEVYLEKKIPIAAGLGGGSSNAACTIIALNSLWELNLSDSRMEDIAAQFGSDIGFFLQGGTAWATNRGEVVEPCPDLIIDDVLLVNPNIAISSAEAYNLVRIPEVGDRKAFDQNAWKDCCFNRLETGIRARYQKVDEIVRTLSEAGAKPAMMSGSGSTCFGVFHSKEQMLKCKSYFEHSGYWTYITRTITRKEYQSVFKA